ncbi:helix-turn-helix domain-containing protein [Mitsuokella sp.]|uniref:helix-turn-helix domain-containing protein n=1 Tax=Mitsuokella sp. TaxID=2049034 RepID=UPI003D7CD968
MNVNEIIAVNLQDLRLRQNKSLGQLAEETGLSKAVLSNIEKGRANPTINTIWKIAEALHVPYSALLEPRQAAAHKIAQSDLVMQSDEQGHYRIGCYYPSTPERDFECFLLAFDPGVTHVTEGHTEHSHEYIFVREGKLKLEVAGQFFYLQTGDSLTFDATLRHIYTNEGEGISEALCINHYPRG